MDPTAVRLIAILLFIMTGPAVMIAYLIMTLVIPEPSVQV
jgi:phage shock protein PspC (stress-responsive transcriptional regulator)